ncbi:hypothetical protein [Desulfosarcina ovata]|nr:hypothetical protein [Desulfosarcina ovata]
MGTYLEFSKKMQPSGEQGEVVIKTKSGHVAADSFTQPLEQLFFDIPYY